MSRGRTARTQPLLPALLCGWAFVHGAVAGSVETRAGSAARAAERAVLASPGEAIYRQGNLPSGGTLTAVRDPDVTLTGAAAACVNCHRRSGLGMKEGRRTIPPIAASYLFHPRAGTVDDLDLPFVEGMQADRDPYTPETLARAIRAGIRADGQPLSYLMPHFALNDQDMAALIDYLRQLSPGAVPGVSHTMLHFATVITPDTDPARRKAMLDVLTQFFDDKNHFTRAESPRLRSSRRMMFKVNLHWELHVWQLTGEPQTWESQLRAHLAAEPVFAVISGLGGRTWAPVQQFCEAEALPCLFPNVDLPVDRETDFDTVYFSRGVLLEAQLVARQLDDVESGGNARRVVQVYRQDDVGRDAAAVLRAALEENGGRPVGEVVLPAGSDTRQLRRLASAVRSDDALVLWLRPKDLAALGAPPGPVRGIYVSGRMGGLERAPLPPAWRALAQITYPYALPERRRVPMDYPLGWFRMRHIAVIDEPLQADTYLACNIVSETLNHMVDTFVRDYLVERIEEGLEHRVITGYYPRLSLAQTQRFASKGGYMVRFADPQGERILPASDWIVP
ncbi:MAG: c-type cytochrome [Proteobacteria bacterium]|nr:c-type cytochrome [Pseudomonadota bacterium]